LELCLLAIVFRDRSNVGSGHVLRGYGVGREGVTAGFLQRFLYCFRIGGSQFRSGNEGIGLECLVHVRTETTVNDAWRSARSVEQHLQGGNVGTGAEGKRRIDNRIADSRRFVS